MTKFKRLLVLSIAGILGLGLAACNETPSASVEPTPTPQPTEPAQPSTPAPSTPAESTPAPSTPDVQAFNAAAKAAEFIEASLAKETTVTANKTLNSTQEVTDDEDNFYDVAIEWSIELAEGAPEGIISLSAKDETTGKYTLSVVYDADTNTAATNFKLIAKLTDTLGNEEEVVFDCVVPEFKYATLEEFLKVADKGETVSVKGKVVAIYKSGVYLVNEQGEGFYAYAPKVEGGSPSQQYYFETYPVGTEVLVSGTATIYNGQPEFESGCSITIVGSAAADYEIPYASATEAFTSGDKDALKPLINTVVTLEGVTIGHIDPAPNYYYYFTLGENQYYLRTSGSYNNFTTTDGDLCVNNIVAEWVQGYKANLKGLVGIYNGNYYITPIEMDAVTITERTLSDSAKVDIALSNADLSLSGISEKGSYDLPATGENGVALTYSIKEGSAGVEIVDGKLVVTQANEEQSATLVVTATLGETTSTREIALTISKKGMNLLVSAELSQQGVDTGKNGNKVEGKFYAAGYVKEIKNSTYGNVLLTDQNGEDIYLYGLYNADGTVRFDSMTEKPVVGDYLFVYSDNVTYYNGYQLSNAKLLGNLGAAKPEAGVDTVLAAGAGLTTNQQVLEGTYSYQVAGVVTSVANTQYGNLYVEDAEGNELYVYGLYTADGKTRYDSMTYKPVEGDFVVINVDCISYYNGVQAKNAKLTAVYNTELGKVEVKAVAGSTEEPEEPGTNPDEPVVPSDPAADSTLTVKQALELGASKAHNTYTEGKYYVTGVITEVYNTQYGNMKIKDEEGNILTVYGTYSADGSTSYQNMEVKPVAGDTVTVYGIVGQYNGTAQLKNAWITDHKVPGSTEPEEPGTNPEEPETPTVITTIEAALSASEGAAVKLEGVTVTKIYEDWSSYNNMSFYVSDGTKEILVFRTSNRVYLGDVVTVDGKATIYSNKVQIAQGATVSVTTAHTHDYADATCATPASCKACGVAKDDVLAAHNYVEGVCSVCSSIDPEYEGTVVAPQNETFAVKANAGTLASDNKSISWNAENFTIVVQKGSNTNAIRTSDSDHFRVYQGNTFTVTANSGKITKIVITCTSSSYATVLAKNAPAGVTASVSGSVVTFTVENLESVTLGASAQWRLNKIEVHYIAE